MKEEAESLKKEAELLKETLNTKSKKLNAYITENEIMEKKASKFNFCTLLWH